MSATVKLCVSVVCLDVWTKKTMIVFEKQEDKNVINIPTGGVEEGENPLTAAKRELFEETGLVVDETDLIFAGNTLLETSKGVNYFTMVYAISKVQETSTEFVRNPEDDVYDSKWLSFEEINSLKSSHRNGFIERKIRMAVSALWLKQTQ